MGLQEPPKEVAAQEEKLQKKKKRKIINKESTKITGFGHTQSVMLKERKPLACKPA